MQNDIAISITALKKIYDNGFKALQDINLEIRRGEIFALLGPNGAGKTTLINTICGIVQPTSGTVAIAGYDNITQYREARTAVGLVPQELTTDAFETVWNTVTFSRGLFGKAKSSLYIEELLKRLSLWDKKDEQIQHLSGGMKRRVMVAKALSHEPEILFLDEPTAGVDVELRKSMWAQVRTLRETGITIILTTHYIEEAQIMADRVGIINKGNLILTEEKNTLMEKMGKRQMIFVLREPLSTIPSGLRAYPLTLEKDDNGGKLILTYDAETENDISEVLDNLKSHGIRPKDIYSHQSSLEEIFIGLLGVK
ncbi:ABC transporter ATP-binding protein [Legionella parisiensis]|uniref:Doxorubicin resistance ATP-binding protein DrrA n=1 Tax=Legionella parisiensis TaxID=45071 RepID=A0A1E5JPT7_9GAMM|nr:ABC transporter ATP-binding protein [Legionella parisiensis]KTD44410.1 ABC transporter ATP binding protein [Legionella parisiensis]OEH46535.1 Doxorubicin resistance ATP-binding protein DrrA [Legionella parisiensis]STX72038.1 antibiotic transport system ATP-binding protein [Legionella parisiensis]